MVIKRIKPPKFRVGRYVLNEYELRQMFVDNFNTPFKFKDLQTGKVHTYDKCITSHCESTSMMSQMTMNLIKLKRAEEATNG